MAAKINRSVVIHGVRKWIRANSEQEYAEKLAALFGTEKTDEPEKHIFSEYAENWFNVYSLPNIETATATTYRRQLTLYLFPAFGALAVEDITTDEIQKLFNLEIKRTKTNASVRVIGLSAIAAGYLEAGDDEAFIFGGDTPLTYQRVRRMCERIKRDTGFEENITPIRFRTTVLTDIYDQTKDVKTAQAAAGHASPTMTMRRYAKGRDGAGRSSSVIDRVYGSN